MIQDLFKVPLYYTNLTLDNEVMAKYCLSMSKKDKGCIRSNEGGWQSNNLQGSHPILNNLFVSIQEHSNIFNKQLDFKRPLNIGNIWININGYKDFNKLHNHPDSTFSGVYYVKTPKDCGNIYFDHPSYDTFQYDWDPLPKNQYNLYNTTQCFYPSIVGRLYIFPSWLNHYVQPNLNKKEKRISISFNLS